MPIYDYSCAACGAEFEKLVKMSTPEGDVACPSCGAHEANKQLSVFAVGKSSSTKPLAPCGEPVGSCGGGGCALEA